MLDVIEDRFISSLTIIKEAKKLPVNEGLATDYEETFTVKKEHFKEGRRPSEDIEETVFTVPLLSLYLPHLLEKFFQILEDLEKILPEDVVNKFRLKINSSEKIDFLNYLLETKAEEESEEDIYKTVAYLDYIKTKNNKGYLYEHIEEWS